MFREDVKKIILWFMVFVIVFVLVALFIIFGGYMKSQSPVEMQTCGDGTFYETCSLDNPYFCNAGILVENVALCGCPKGTRKIGDSCDSEYLINPLEISLKYVLRGEENLLNLTVYGGVVDYLKELPRSIYYSGKEIPQRIDFKLLKTNDEIQRDALLPFVNEIRNLAPDNREDQMRIAVSLIQNIPYIEPENVTVLNGRSLRVARYPYQVLYDYAGSCEGKSELLSFILRELDYGVALFYYGPENHESVGIKCPVEKSLIGSGYCFIETTSPWIIGDDRGEYLGTGKLVSKPEVVVIDDGISLGEKLDEYKDSKRFMNLRDGKSIWVLFKDSCIKKLSEKYGLAGIL
ncbi:hypothetical protein HOD29_00890 [archaeon]|jgi:hypothetical protein|nr:hypothetical protein [archaeon]